MRGVIFTELFELVEQKFGYDLLDEVIEGAKLDNDGAYAATGNYPFEELLRIVTVLSERSNIPVSDLLEVYGEHLFTKLIAIIPEAADIGNVIDFIKGVETYIHVEVRKLYPNAELPTFEVLSSSSQALELNYVSSKNIPQLAKGLMMGASKYFKQPIEITFELSEEGKTHFTIVKV
jgi:hypothetical protein